MSPEQACGKEVDGRSDLYSLGCAMYHVITGRLPFPGESPIERLGRRINGRPVPIGDVLPDLPKRFYDVMDRLMAQKPIDRYQTGVEAAEGLRSIQGRKAPKAPVRKPAAEPHPALEPDPALAGHEIVTIVPDYPAWFRPMAELEEQSPLGALFVILAMFFACFAVGFLLALLIR
jgi:serine/threonine-protein kinase